MKAFTSTEHFYPDQPPIFPIQNHCEWIVVCIIDRNTVPSGSQRLIS